MFIKTANFTGSYPSIDKCPKPTKPEYAFIGRSNVGKSSLINMLTNNKKLAKTSGTPGKTQMINYFLIDDTWFLVDLPGYGYAKLSKKHRESLERMIKGYLAKRENLYCVFHLIDSRIPPQKIDLAFANWMGANGVPFVQVFTKTDKLKANELQKSITTFKKAMAATWDELPQMFISSSVSKQGQEDILGFIQEVNE